MDLVTSSYMPGDPRLIDQIVYELKSQGIFDQFRKECIADVDTKPAYQNLRQRVEGNVSSFLSQQKWREDMNKNQVREQLRKNISESGFLETGVERIVDQVVNPKINSVFLPKVEDVVYRFLGLEKPNREVKKELKVNVMDLLPNDLEAVSPESEHGLSLNDSFEKAEEHTEIINDNKSVESTNKTEDESPAFEPIEVPIKYSPQEENSLDSHLSGMSGLASHDSNHSADVKSSNQMELSQDTSQNSTESQSSMVTSEESSKMEISESTEEDNTQPESITKSDNDFDRTYSKESNTNMEVLLAKCSEEIKVDTSQIQEETEITSEPRIRKDEKKCEDVKTNNHDKSKYDKEKKSDKDKKSNDKEKKSSKDYKSSSKHSSNHNSSKDRDKKDRDDTNDIKDKEIKKDKDKHREKEKSRDKENKDKSSSKDSDKDKSSREKSDRDKSKSSSSSAKHSKDRSSSSKKSDQYKDKETSSKSGSSSKDRTTSESKEKRVKEPESSTDKEVKDKNSNVKDKDKKDVNKDKDKYSSKEKSSSGKHKEGFSKSKESSKKEKDKENPIKTKDKYKSNKEKDRGDINKDSANKDSSGKESKPAKDKTKLSSVDCKDKGKEKRTDGDEKLRSPDKQKKSEKVKSSKKHSHSSKKEKDKKPKDDHYSLKEKKNERRSTDRDSNDGNGGKMSRNSSFSESNSQSHKSSNKSSSLFSSGSGDSGNSDQIENIDQIDYYRQSITYTNNEEVPTIIKYKKPKFASNMQEAIRLMKIRKHITKLERNNKLALAVAEQKAMEKGAWDKMREEPTKTEIVHVENSVSEEVTTEEPTLHTTELSKERWEELEARLAQEMSNVISNSYAQDEEECCEYDAISISPMKNKSTKMEESIDETVDVQELVELEEVGEVEEVITEEIVANTECVEIIEDGISIVLSPEDEESKELITEIVNQPERTENTASGSDISNMELKGNEHTLNKETLEPNETAISNEAITTECEETEKTSNEENTIEIKTNNIIMCDNKSFITTPVTEVASEQASESPKTEEVRVDDDKTEIEKNAFVNNGQLGKSQEGTSKYEDKPCLYLCPPSPISESNLKDLNLFIEKLGKAIEAQCIVSQNNAPKKKRGRKRKFDETLNNNKVTPIQPKDTKRGYSTSAYKKKATENDICDRNDVSHNQKFNLPLSPADSDGDSKREEPVTVKTKRPYGRASFKKYDTADLYKPRPVFSRSRRSRGANVENS